ncbi:MAG: signal peptidase II [Notoacmeibacter sp.]|nr:signal peptidase II [Notoacmeibacter sp.]MCC0032400.1 signal peptidase II [Brucellaceae bacterium]
MTLARAWMSHALLLVALVALDQWVKHLVETGMEYHQQIGLLPFFSLFRTHNEGVAFSLLEGFGPGGLLALSAVIIGFVLWLAAQSKSGHRFARLGFVMILAGALGNMIDRALLGYVVDYFLFHTPGWSFAVFNLADTWITVGAGLVILEEALDWRRSRQAPPPSAD